MTHLCKQPSELPCHSNLPSQKRWLQIWPQLTIHNDVLYRRIRSPLSPTTQLLIVVPLSLRSHYLQQCHDIPIAGHQGVTKTLARLRESVYWIGMASDVHRYCDSCDLCNQSKPPLPTPLLLVSTPIGKNWEMVAVDVLQVPMSQKGNSYLLVLQDYFTKWLEAIPMKDQQANTILRIVIDVFTRFGMPHFLHSDQGRNFESFIIRETCNAFGITKSHTTPYHPQGDGLVERSNRSLLQMLRSFTSQESDSEHYLPLLLYAYRTSQHSSTKFTPYFLMFGRDPKSTLSNDHSHSYDLTSYGEQLTRKMAELYEFVEGNLVEAATKQKKQYDYSSNNRCQFQEGDSVWLSIPTNSKLAPRWESGWTIISKPRSPNVKIEHTDGRLRVVHVNRIRLHYLR